MARSGTKPARSGAKALIELVVTVAIAIALALLIQAFIVKPYRIPSGSMLPTLHLNQRVLANRLFNKPSIGHIVVFHPPAGAEDGDGVCGNSNEGNAHAQACGKPTPQESNTTS